MPLDEPLKVINTLGTGGRVGGVGLAGGVAVGAGEAQFPALCRLMMEVMPKYYGMSESGLRFWSVHIPIDEKHTSSAVKLVGPHLDDPDARRQLREGVWSHMELRWHAYMEPLLDFADFA